MEATGQETVNMRQAEKVTAGIYRYKGVTIDATKLDGSRPAFVIMWPGGQEICPSLQSAMTTIQSNINRKG